MMRATEGRAVTPEERGQINALDAGMKTEYDAAYFGAANPSRTIDQNSPSSIGEPLRRAEPLSKGRGGSSSQASTGDLPMPAESAIETGMPSTSKNSATGTSDNGLEGELTDRVYGDAAQGTSDAPQDTLVADARRAARRASESTPRVLVRQILPRSEHRRNTKV